MPLDADDYCFACGPANPIGLQLRFDFEGDDYVAHFIPAAEHQGFVGMTHGGIVATVLDETMARLLWVRDIPALTARLEMRLRQPVPTGSRTTARARIVADRGRLLDAEAELRLEDGTVAATARATLARV